MDIVQAKQKSTCQFKRANGNLCKRSVALAEKHCWQHAHGLFHRWKSLTRNQTVVFVLGVSGLVVTVAFGLMSLSSPTKQEIAREVVDTLPKIGPPAPEKERSVIDSSKAEDREPPPAKKRGTDIHTKHEPAAVNEPPAFAVAVESKLLVMSPSKDEAGTGFWGVGNVGREDCFLRSADVVMMVRIKSLEPVKTLITAYNVYGMGGELKRIKMTEYVPVQILRRGIIHPGFKGKASIAIPAPSGNVGGSLLSSKFSETDFSVAVLVDDSVVLDKELVDHYVEPGETIRGWAFFEYPNAGAMPVHLTLRISDDLGHTFSYPIPDEAGNPAGDTLRRVITLTGPTMDLSSCTRQPHQVSFKK